MCDERFVHSANYPGRVEDAILPVVMMWEVERQIDGWMEVVKGDEIPTTYRIIWGVTTKYLNLMEPAEDVCWLDEWGDWWIGGG